MSEYIEMPEPTSEEASLARGLCGVIDRALERHRAGETFVYGIHQKVAPGVLESLRRHYMGSGWSSVALREGATGSHLLVLTP